LQRENPDQSEKKPEEDFENLKLRPILTEAFELVQAIDKHIRKTEKKI
jgi:hypothetical protein